MEIDDRYDRRILQALQYDGRITNQRLAKQVDLSAAPCWRRVNRLEKDGVISRYVALLDGERLGLHVMVYVHVSLIDHHSATLDEFNAFVAQSDSVLECYSVSGEYDYLMRVVAASVKDIEAFLMHDLLRVPAVRNANTSFVLKQSKYTTALPV